jgi:hypothetical protein
MGTGLSPIAVGEGLLVISSGQGLHAYSRQSTIIADESRVLEVDTAGRVVWSTENTQLDFYTGSIVCQQGALPDYAQRARLPLRRERTADCGA